MYSPFSIAGLLVLLAVAVSQAQLSTVDRQPWKSAEYQLSARLSGVAGRWLEANWQRLKSDGDFLIMAFEIPPDRRAEFWEAFYDVWADQFQYEIEWLKKTERMTGDEIHERVPSFLASQPVSNESLVKLAELHSSLTDTRESRFRFAELRERREVMGAAGVDDKIDATKGWNAVAENRTILGRTHAGKPIAESRLRSLEAVAGTLDFNIDHAARGPRERQSRCQLDGTKFRRVTSDVSVAPGRWKHPPGTLEYLIEHRKWTWQNRLNKLTTNAVLLGRFRRSIDSFVDSAREDYARLFEIEARRQYDAELQQIEVPLESMLTEVTLRLSR